jgi:hypothetical protein
MHHMVVTAIEAVSQDRQIRTLNVEQALFSVAHCHYQIIGSLGRRCRVEHQHTCFMGIARLLSTALLRFGGHFGLLTTRATAGQPASQCSLNGQCHRDSDNPRQPPQQAWAETAPQRGQPQQHADERHCQAIAQNNMQPTSRRHRNCQARIEEPYQQPG